MLRVGAAIETALAGAYASAAATASTLELRALLAQVAASEGQHVAVLNHMRGGAPAPSFPELLDVEQASAALGPFFGDWRRMRYALSLSFAIAIGLTGVASAGPTAQITVYAAASLTEVFPEDRLRARGSRSRRRTRSRSRSGRGPPQTCSPRPTRPATRRPFTTTGSARKPSIFATNKLVVVYPESNPGNVKTVFRPPGGRA